MLADIPSFNRRFFFEVKFYCWHLAYFDQREDARILLTGVTCYVPSVL